MRCKLMIFNHTVWQTLITADCTLCAKWTTSITADDARNQTFSFQQILFAERMTNWIYNHMVLGKRTYLCASRLPINLIFFQFKIWIQGIGLCIRLIQTTLTSLHYQIHHIFTAKYAMFIAVQLEIYHILSFTGTILY